MKTKVYKYSSKPLLSREHIVKLGDSLFNGEEVEAVKLEVLFKDKSKLSYESGTKRKAMIEAEVDSMVEEDEDD